MPSKEELCYSPEEKSRRSSTNPTFLSRDIDDLVREIKDNLRLKAKPNLATAKTKLRASPYSVPSRTDSKCGCCNSHRCLRRGGGGAPTSGSATHRPDDPYEVLQGLLKEGDLIKEAVKRLQVGVVPKRCAFYDSDEEYRTPPFPLDDVEV